MKKVLLYFLFVFCGLLLIDLSYRYLCVETFENPSERSGVHNNNKIIFVNKPYNIAILGASRAECHYRVKIIEDSLNWTSYNYGGSGGSILQQYLALIRALNNGSLKLVLLDMTPGQLSNKWVKDRTSTFYPYYWVNDTIRSIVKEVEGCKMDILMNSSLIQYNSCLTSVIMNVLNFDNSSFNENGFRPLKYTGKDLVVYDKDIEHEKITSNGGYNSDAIIYFHKMVSICNENGIKLVVCLSPSLVLDNSERNFIKNLAENDNVDCWDYTDSITDHTMFSDASHLNEKGADLFTNVIIGRLKIYVNNEHVCN